MAWSDRVTATCSGCAPTSDSHSLNGYALGGGLEYGVTQNISVKAEYLYTHLTPVNFFNNAGCVVNCSAGENVSTFRIGANWRFTGFPF
jgi:outer membrane immunogenic protein